MNYLLASEQRKSKPPPVGEYYSNIDDINKSTTSRMQRFNLLNEKVMTTSWIQKYNSAKNLNLAVTYKFPSVVDNAYKNKEPRFDTKVV